jgi:hypothetical protein
LFVVNHLLLHDTRYYDIIFVFLKIESEKLSKKNKNKKNFL